MNTIKKVVSTVWYNKENYHELRNIFPDSEFVYVNFYDKEKLAEEVRDADVAIILGDVDNCLASGSLLVPIFSFKSSSIESTRSLYFFLMSL